MTTVASHLEAETWRLSVAPMMGWAILLINQLVVAMWRNAGADGYAVPR